MARKQFPTRGQISIEQAKRILSASGREKIPQMKIEAVTKKLNFWFDFFVAGKQLDQSARGRAFAKLRKIEEHALRISKLLELGPEAPHINEFLEDAAIQRAEEFNSYRGLGFEPANDSQQNRKEEVFGTNTYLYGSIAVDRAINAAGYLAVWARDAQKFPMPKRAPINPIIKLFGWIIPRCYQQIYAEEFGVTRGKDNVPSGPGIRFAMAFLQEVQITKTDGSAYSAESIVKAFTDVKRGTTRRR